MASAILNVIIAPLLIFGLAGFPRLELAGAAFATLIARAVIVVAALWVLHARLNLITTSRVTLERAWRSWRGILHVGEQASKEAVPSEAEALAEQITRLDVHGFDELNEAITALRKEMRESADKMDYERATQLRDRAQELEALRLKLL